jgi:hypothetical protein
MKAELSLQFSRDSVTSPYLKAYESALYPTILFI